MSRTLVSIAALGLLAACRSPVTQAIPASKAEVLVANTALAPALGPAAPLAATSEPSAARDPGALAALDPRGRERCPDELLARGTGEAELAVRVEDARADRRTILPLDLSLALASAAPAQEARYAAELLIASYEAPRHFRRLNAPRSEWAAGRLEGRLLVWDRSARRVVCQAQVKARGDANGASIRRRLRESTRQKLETKLYSRTRTEMEGAIGGISSVFRLKSPIGAASKSAPAAAGAAIYRERSGGGRDRSRS